MKPNRRYFEPQNVEQKISNIEVIILHFSDSVFYAPSTFIIPCSILSFGLPTLRAGPQFRYSFMVRVRSASLVWKFTTAAGSTLHEKSVLVIVVIAVYSCLNAKTKI